MIYEAQAATTLGSNPARRLGSRPEIVKSLVKYSAEVQELLTGGLHIVTIEAQDFVAALQIQKNIGLLTNDSLVAAAAIRHGIRALATADSHFDSIPSLDIYKPSDI